MTNAMEIVYSVTGPNSLRTAELAIHRLNVRRPYRTRKSQRNLRACWDQPRRASGAVFHHPNPRSRVERGENSGAIISGSASREACS